MPKTINLDDALSHLSRSPSLVVGPGITSTHTVFRDVADAILPSISDVLLEGTRVESYLDIFEKLDVDDAIRFETIRRSVREQLASVHASPNVYTLAKLRWAAIISLTPEYCLEGVLREQIDSLASSRSLTLVDSPRVSPDLRTTPVFKLLGNPRSKRPESSAVTSQSELLLRQQAWPDLLATFSDYVREGWVLLVGTEAVQSLVERLFATLFAFPAPRPTNFMVLKGDAITSNPVVTDLLRGRATIYEVECTIKQYCVAVANKLSEPHQYHLRLDPETPDNSDIEKFLLNNKSLLRLVPDTLPTDFDKISRHHQLVDALFRPTNVDWNPFLAGYHLSRSQAVSLAEEISVALAEPILNQTLCYVLRGEAGTGKTCAMKELATLLAKNGVLCFWIHGMAVESAQSAIKGLVSSLAELLKHSKDKPTRRIALILDEPWAARISPGDIVSELNANGLPIAIVVSFRNSELMTDAGITIPLPVLVDDDIELSMSLDEDEKERLAEVLARIGASSDIEEARGKASSLAGRNASDVLCALWFLIPETRSSISTSIEDEYFALGNIESFVQHVAENVGHLNEKAKRAYQCAAVCSDLKLGIPTEVLVRAMEVNYDEWLDMCSDGRPLWGLLYPDFDEIGEQTVYWTRNDVVTKILLDLVNGGLGHAGEVGVLATLIRACSTGSSVYRTFLVDLLVRNRKKLSDRFTLEQGVQLFELARTSLPHPDKTLEHQYGLWLKDKGASTDDAHKQLLKALSSPDYPTANTQERAEHIHTSIAAVVVSQAKEGKRSPESALADVKEHLRLAQSPSFFNPHTTHVFANLLLELAHMYRDSGEGNVQLQAVEEALASIEKTFQLIGGSGKSDPRFAKDLGMLSALQEKLLNSLGDDEQIEILARKLFETTRNQMGFVVLARKKLLGAAKRGRGRDYRVVKEYLDRCLKEVEEAGETPSERIIAARVDLYIRWQLQSVGGAIDWSTLLQDLEFLCRAPMYKDDMMKLFYLAVALFHSDRASDAYVVFHRLRGSSSPKGIKSSARCYLLGKEGSPKRVQGKIRKSHDRWYVEAPEYETDFVLRARGQNVVDGRDIHCYVGFTFFGPFAQLDKPGIDALLLPL